MANLEASTRRRWRAPCPPGRTAPAPGSAGSPPRLNRSSSCWRTGRWCQCSATARPELFAAARVGLGALGVITAVTLRCVPSFALLADERPVPVEEVLEQFDALADGNNHFEFYWFPYGRQALVKRNNRLSPGGSGSAARAPVRTMPRWRRFWEFEVMENAAFGDAVPDRPGQAAPHPRAEQVLFGRAVLPVLYRPVPPGVRDPPPGPLRRVRVRRST